MARLLMVCLLFGWPLLAMADEGGIRVDNAWSRAAISGHNGAVYLTITDTGAADRLKAISTPVARQAEVHESFTDNGVMKMRPAPLLAIVPGKPLTLAPGGYHVMLLGLNKSLAKGDNFPITLTFENAPPVTVQVRVEGAGAAAPDGTAGHDMGMSMPTK